MIETYSIDKGCIAIMNATDTKQQQQQSTATSTTMLENMSQKIHIDTKSNGNSSTQIPQPITSSNHHTQPQSIQNSIKTQQNDSTNNASIDSVKNCNLNLNDTNTTSENPSTKVTNITEDDDKNNNDVSTRMEIESEIEKVKKDDDSDEDPFADIEVATMDLYDITNYTFGKKNEESKCKMLQAMTLEKLSQALQKSYKERGMRRSVGAVLIIHSHNFPHVLLLQRHDGKGEFALPGGRLRPGESDEEGLLRKLRNKLYPIDEETPVNTDDDDEEQQLDVGEKSKLMIFFLFIRLTITKAVLFFSIIFSLEIPFFLLFSFYSFLFTNNFIYIYDSNLILSIVLSFVFFISSRKLVCYRFFKKILSIYSSSCYKTKRRITCLCCFLTKEFHVCCSQQFTINCRSSF